MMTAALGILSTTLLFWSATVAGEWRSAVIGIAGFAILVVAMLTAHAGKAAESEQPRAAICGTPDLRQRGEAPITETKRGPSPAGYPK